MFLRNLELGRDELVVARSWLILNGAGTEVIEIIYVTK
jgi:hypothetical protein